jgi:hypothetical protein
MQLQYGTNDDYKGKRHARSDGKQAYGNGNKIGKTDMGIAWR